MTSPILKRKILYNNKPFPNINPCPINAQWTNISSMPFCRKEASLAISILSNVEKISTFFFWQEYMHSMLWRKRSFSIIILLKMWKTYAHVYLPVQYQWLRPWVTHESLVYSCSKTLTNSVNVWLWERKRGVTRVYCPVSLPLFLADPGKSPGC